MTTRSENRRRSERRRSRPTPQRGAPGDRLLHNLGASLSEHSGAGYFQFLTQYLRQSLGMACAFVGVLLPDQDALDLLSVSCNGKLKAGSRLDLRQGFCRRIYDRGLYTCPRGARRHFPNDRLLAELGAESCVGAALRAASGEPLGLVAVIGHQPLRARQIVESVLQIVAACSAAELERRRLYRELGESYRTLATLMANLPGLVYRCRNDRDWTMEFISEGCLPLTGYAPDAFVKHRTISYGELIHPDDREPVWNEVQVALRENRPFHLVYRLNTAGGELKWVWEQGRGVFNSRGELLALEGFITDITERKRTEEALRESESWLRAIVQTALDVIIVLSPDHRILEFNPEAERVYGRRREEVLGRDYFELFLPPDHWPAVDADLRTVLAGTPMRSFENTVGAADGSRHRMIWNLSRLDDGAGVAVGIVAVGHDVTEHRRTERVSRELAERLQTVVTSLPLVLFTLDRDGVFTLSEGKGLAALGLRAGEVVGRSVFEVYRDFPRILHDIRRALDGESFSAVAEVAGHSFEVWYSPLTDARGAPRGAIGVAADITERKKAEAQMQKLSRALEQIADTVMITDRHGVIEYVNPTFAQVTGYEPVEAVGRRPNLLKSGRQGPGYYENLWKTILAGEVFSDVFINRRKDGSLYYEEKTITPLTDADGRITHFVATGKDITERMQVQERLAYMAQHDPLTELPNRALLLDRLKQSLAGARWRDRRTAVLFVDLDRFKTINDTLGHEAGDRLLQQLAARFQANVREGDTVARFGGDEFVILLDDVASADDVAGVAQKVLQALAAPFEVDHHALYVTASIGVSLFPGDGEDASTLLKNADTAMYRAKELGKNTYQFYSAEMSARAFERLTLESSLRHALEREEFRLHYQPQVDVETGTVVGVEALLRWQHPEFGLIAPADFVPLLEETGLIVPVGKWVLRTACVQLQAWRAQGWPELRLAVNLSPRQFQAQDLAASVREALASTGSDPATLELEITEGLLLRHAPATVETLEVLSALGVRMAVDDFGTGYSSLSYLQQLPIDTLKIDRAFVRDIPHDPDDSAITTAIIALAQSLKLETIAEGVENAAQRDFLRARGCRLMQGYLFSRPLPPEDLTRLLQAQKPD
jgi:diguanylate cyclase (GGDEF)-like protein/PAS domain S-box-containing protein